MVYSKVGWLRCPHSTLLVAAKSAKDESSLKKKERDVALLRSNIMNIVLVLWKGFFILTMTVLRRAPSKTRKVNYLAVSAHVSSSLPSIPPSMNCRQSNQMASARHSQSVTFTFTLCSHRYGCHKHALATWMVCQCQSLAYGTLIISSICKQWWHCIPFASLTLPDNPTSMKEPSMRNEIQLYVVVSGSLVAWIYHTGFIFPSPCSLKALRWLPCAGSVLALHDTTSEMLLCSLLCWRIIIC